MHHSDLLHWPHHHHFNPVKHSAERRTVLVVLLTFTTMVAEIVAGMVYGSMALQADGWHMSTHAGALASLGAYGWHGDTAMTNGLPSARGKKRFWAHTPVSSCWGYRRRDCGHVGSAGVSGNSYRL